MLRRTRPLFRPTALVWPLALAALLAVGSSHAYGPAGSQSPDGPDALDPEEAKALLVEARSELRVLNRMTAALERSPLTEAELAAEQGGEGLEFAAGLGRWFAENVRWLPYQGALRGTFGTLVERRANALDQALTLAATLGSTGLKTRIASAQLPIDVATEMHLALLDADRFDARATREPEAIEAEVDTFLKACGLRKDDFAAPLAKARAQAQAWMEDIVPTTIQQAEELRAVLAAGGVQSKDEDLMAAEIDLLRNHHWVQVQRSSPDGDIEWIDVDPLPMRAGVEPTWVPETVFGIDSVPRELEHVLKVRVMARSTGPEGSTSAAAFEQAYLTRELGGSHMELWFHPMNTSARGPEAEGEPFDPDAALMADALAETEWQPTLIDVSYEGGQTMHRQKSILISGRINDDPVHDIRKGKVGDASNILGGIGTTAEKTPTTLSAVWLEYEIATPGQDTRRIRRTVFDLLGPDRRASESAALPELTESEHTERALALSTISSLRPTSSDLPEEFLTREKLRASVINQRTLVEIASALADGQPIAIDDLAGRFKTPPIDLSQLAFSRFRLGRHAGRAFLGQLNLLATHTRPFLSATQEPGATSTAAPGLTLARTIDIVENTVNVRGTLEEDAADSFTVRIEQGVLDTVLESQMYEGLGRSVAEGSSGPANTSQLARIRPIRGWALITASGSSEAAHPMQARVTSLRQAPGHVAVAPPAAGADETPASFWSVDPQTGTTLGIGPRGWGQSGEYAIEVSQKVSMIGPVRYYSARAICVFAVVLARFAFEFALRAGLPGGVGAYVSQILTQLGLSTGAMELALAACNAGFF